MSKTKKREKKQKKTKRSFLSKLKRFFWVVICLGLFGAICVLVVLNYFASNLPSLDDMINPVYDLPTQVYDRNNNLIREFATKRRVEIQIDQVPEVMIKALLAIEDNRFYDHYGIDPIRIIGALIVDIRERRAAQGGSTLTMQTAKQFLFSSEKLITRKIKELLLAFKMERIFTKNQILERYLNKIYFGSGAYGIEAATRRYFGKTTAELNLQEAATLAGVLNRPGVLAPTVNMERSLKRRNLVLRTMRDAGYITTEEMEQAQQTPIELDLDDIIEYNETSYYIEHVRRYIQDKYGTDALYKGGMKVYTAMDVDKQVYAQTALTQGLKDHDRRQGYRGPRKNVLQEIDEELGLLIFSEEEGWDQEAYELLPATIQETIQSLFAEKIQVETAENSYVIGGTVLGVVTRITKRSADVDMGKHQGSILLSDIRWARPVDYAERFSYKTRLSDINDILKMGDVIELELLNYSNGAREFSMALSQKPIANGAIFSMDPNTGHVLAMSGGADFRDSEFNRATQAKRQTGSIFKAYVYAIALDSSFTTASMLKDTPITGGQGSEKWKPENYSGKYQGKVSLRNGLVDSKNLPSIHLTKDLGTDTVIKHANRFGIEEGDLPNNDPTIVLGTTSLTLEEMVKGFGVFASGGKLVEPIYITRVLDRNGKVLEENNETISKQAISKETAFLMTNILEDVVERGTGRRAQAINRPSAGKTGTSDDVVDAWYLGYIPQLITGVFVGFDKNQQPLGDNEQGAVTALPIWVEYMKEASRTMAILPFTQPEGITMVPVNENSGLRECEPTGNSIIEYFKNGTEPTECHQAFNTDRALESLGTPGDEELENGEADPLDEYLEEL